MLREFSPVVVAETCCRVVMVVMGELMIPDPGLLTKAYVQQGMQSLPVWTSIALPTTALIKFGI